MYISLIIYPIKDKQFKAKTKIAYLAAKVFPWVVDKLVDYENYLERNIEATGTWKPGNHTTKKHERAQQSLNLPQ